MHFEGWDKKPEELVIRGNASDMDLGISLMEFYNWYIICNRSLWILCFMTGKDSYVVMGAMETLRKRELYTPRDRDLKHPIKGVYKTQAKWFREISGIRNFDEVAFATGIYAQSVKNYSIGKTKIGFDNLKRLEKLPTHRPMTDIEIVQHAKEITGRN